MKKNIILIFIYFLLLSPCLYGQQKTPQPVDLGLSVKWASYNIGATSSSEIGDLFCWGNLDKFDAIKNPYCKYVKTNRIVNTAVDGVKQCLTFIFSYTDYTLTKYCTDAVFGPIDSKTQLDIKDDAANYKWGRHWHMPTKKEFNELLEKCSWSYTTFQGVKGYIVLGPNGNTIFFPVISETAYYWTSTLSTTDSLQATSVILSKKKHNIIDIGRINQCFIRPVYR